MLSSSHRLCVALLVLGLMVPGCMAQATLSRSALLGISFALIGVVIIGFIVLGLVLSYKNRHAEHVSNTHPHIVLRFLKFFMRYLFFELLSIPFTVAGIIALQNTPWGGVNVTPISIAFYIFLALKYCVVIFILLYENIGLYHLGPADQEIAITARYRDIGQKIRLPPTWITMVEGGVFIPVLMIEGMINNGEFRIAQDVADLFPYDVVVLVVIDSVLYLKLHLSYVLDIFGPKPYNIRDVIYAMINVVVTLVFTFLFICYHLAEWNNVQFSLVREPLLIVMLIIPLIHNTLASFTSMLLQGIVFRCRALKGSPLRIDLVNLYLRWFSGHPLWIILNVLAYAAIFGLYVICFIVAALMLRVTVQDPAISAMILVVGILSLVVTSWLLLNLIYGVLKRLGSYFASFFRCSRGRLPCFVWIRCSWIPEIAFNCSSYATEMNKILSECGGGWSFNSDMRR